jgi:hypothetical protein
MVALNVKAVRYEPLLKLPKKVSALGLTRFFNYHFANFFCFKLKL